MKRTSFYRCMMVMIVMGLVWAGLTGAGLADMRIIEQSSGERFETLYKGNRIASEQGEGERIILLCERREVIFTTSQGGGQYWQGSTTEFGNLMDGMMAELPAALGGLGDLEGLGDLGDMEGMGDLAAMFEAMFGGMQQSPDVQVRINEAGAETVAGYAAEKYIVETAVDGNWRVFERLSISPALMREVQAEVGACVDLMIDITADIVGFSLFGMHELEAVLRSEEYRELTARGFPVRSTQMMADMFGSTSETVSQVVEVNHNPISEEAFSVPAGYRRVQSLMDFFDM